MSARMHKMNCYKTSYKKEIIKDIADKEEILISIIYNKIVLKVNLLYYIYIYLIWRWSKSYILRERLGQCSSPYILMKTHENIRGGAAALWQHNYPSGWALVQFILVSR